MNIALTGSHGVGKTTLGKNLYQYYSSRKNVFLSEGIPRNIIERGYPLGQSATIASYTEYMIDQLAALDQADQYDIYISDRTLLDPYAYALANLQVNASLIPEKEIELLYQVWNLERKKYDLYLYLPIQFSMESDGVRPIGEEYRKLVAQTMLDLLKKYNLNYITLYGSPQEMLYQAVNHIKKL